MENNAINSKTFRFDTEPFHCPNMCLNGPFSSFERSLLLLPSQVVGSNH